MKSDFSKTSGRLTIRRSRLAEPLSPLIVDDGNTYRLRREYASGMS